MPLETASFFPDLNSANPAHTDPQAQGDAHIRLIKATVKATFPNFTSAALVSTQAAIDAAVTAVTGGTVSVGAGSAGTPSLNVNGQGGLYSPGAHQLGLETNGIAAVVVNSDQSVNFVAPIVAASTVAAAGAFMGGTGQLVPTGAIFAGLYGSGAPPTGYLFLNGQAVSRTGLASLFALWGTTYGVGNGTTTFNLPNFQEVTPVGQSTMGAAGSPGLITHLANRATLGAVIGEEQHTLSTAELPVHTPSGTIGGSQNFTANDGSQLGATGGSTSQLKMTTGQVSITKTINGSSFTFTGTPIGSGTAHNNVQPSIMVQWIVKT